MTDLPAPDAPQCYVVVGPDDQRGPYTLELLISEVVAERLNENTPVWWPGLADWTTMAAHPGVAAELARRRGGTQAAPMAFAPPTAPPPPQQQPHVEQFTAETAGDPGSVGGAGPATHAAPERGTAGVDESIPVGEQADQSATQQVFGVGTDSPGEAPQAQQPGEQTSGEQASAEQATGDQASADQATADQASGGEATGPDAIEVPAVEVTPADFAAVDGADGGDARDDGFRAAGVGEGLDPVHSDAFAEVVRRSRARADAASIIENTNEALLTAMDEAAGGQGFSSTARVSSGSEHELSYVRADSAVLTVRLGRVRGRDLAGPEGEVPLNAAVSSENYNGSLEAGTGRHGEVLVHTAESGSAFTASVELILGLSDYVDSGYAVDRDALQRDLQSVVATLSHRLGA